MGKEIDEKVVSMKFDNKQFMDKTSESMTQLDKLKNSLQLPGAAKGLDEVNKAAGNVNLNQIGTATDEVSVKFNALQIMAKRVLENIADTAFATGKRIVSAFTIDPIKTGLQEYETQINAVQTILANTESKGTTMDDVNQALDELNAYADKTIYNFTEMTRNIGTFTAAGVDLDTATNAIQGIANLAAVSGSNSQQASTAMYQLSQALSSGTVKLMDWNSVVNAGMGGQVFQDALKETARVHDIAIDDMIEEQGSFRETLSEGWLTSEILTETLQKFTMSTEGLTEAQIEQNRAMLRSKGYTDEQIDGIFKLGNTATNAATKVKTFTQLMDTLKEAAQSGWTQTWEILIGDFEEAKKLWTSVSEVFGKIIGDSAEARNAMLQGWADGGGRQAMLDSFVNIWKALVAIVKPIKEAFREIFPRTTSEQLIKITEAIRDFTASLVLSEKAQKILKSTFKGLFAVLDIVITAIKEIAKGAWTILKALVGLFVDLTGGVAGAAGSFGEWLVSLRNSIKSSGIFTTIVGGIVNAFLKLIDVIKRVVQYIKDSQVFTSIFNGISTALKKMGEVIKTVYSYLKENVKFPSLEGFLVVLKAIWEGIKFVFGKIKDAVGEAGSAFLGAFRQGDFGRALDLFKGGIIAGILLNIKKFTDGFGSFKKGIDRIFKGAAEVLDGVGECLEAFAGRVKAAALLDIAKAMALLTAAIVVLSLLDPKKVNEAVSTITILFAELLGTMTIMNRIGGGEVSMFKTTSAMVVMSFAVILLASALKKLGGLEMDALGRGLIGVAALTGIIVAVAKAMAKNEGVVLKGATGLISFAVSLRLLVNVCKKMAELEWAEMGKGALGIAGFMVILAGAMRIMPKKMEKMAGNLLAITISVGLLSFVMKKFGEMDMASIGKSLLMFGGTILILGTALRLFTSLSSGMAIVNLFSIVAAVQLMVPPLMLLGTMGLANVASSLLLLGGTLAIFVAALHLMNGTMKGAAALIVAAAALNLFVIPLRILGAMNLPAIGIALLAIAGTFIVFGLAALILKPIAGIIMALSISIAAFGIGVLAAGAGLGLFASGLVVLAAACVPAVAAIVTSIGVLLTGIIGFGALIAQALATLITSICTAIASSVGAITSAIAAIIVAVCDAIVKAVPALLNCLGVLLDALLSFILKYIPKIIEVGLKLIIALLDGIASQMPAIVEKGVAVVVAFLEGLGSQAHALIAAAFKLILDLINGLAQAIVEYTPQLFDACINLGKSIMEGIGYGIGAGVGGVWEMIKSVGKGILDGFKKTLGINSPAKEMIPVGQGIDEGVALGMKKYEGVVTDATEDIGDTAIKSMSTAISGIADVIESDMDSQPTIRPVLDLSGVESGASAINSMFGMTPSVGVMSHVGAINSMMSNGQNGGFDVISAIKDLGNKISESSGNTYIIDGITYDDGSNVADAVKSIMRAARIERRV